MTKSQAKIDFVSLGTANGEITLTGVNRKYCGSLLKPPFALFRKAGLAAHRFGPLRRLAGLALRRPTQGLARFQESVLKSKVVRVACPFTGQMLESRISLPLGPLDVLYEFESTQRFYLGLRQPVDGGFPFLFFPKTNAILTSGKMPDGTKAMLSSDLRDLFEQCEIMGEELNAYRANKSKRSIAVEIGHGNFAHHIYNEIQALCRLERSEQIKAIDDLWIHRELVCPVDQVVQDLTTVRILRLTPQRQTIGVRLNRMLNHNALLVKMGDSRLDSQVRNRLITQFATRASELQDAHQTQNRPLKLWISVKCGDRTLTDQTYFLTQICRRAAKEWPGLLIVLVGVSFPIDFTQEIGGRIFTPHFIAQHQQIIDDVRNELRGVDVDIVSVNGEFLSEAFAWSLIMDVYFAHWGSIQHLAGWLSESRGIVHGNLSVVSNPGRLKRFSAVVDDDRYEVLTATAIESETAADFDNKPRGQVNTNNYKLDVDLSFASIKRAASASLRHAVPNHLKTGAKNDGRTQNS